MENIYIIEKETKRVVVLYDSAVCYTESVITSNVEFRANYLDGTSHNYGIIRLDDLENYHIETTSWLRILAEVDSHVITRSMRLTEQELTV